MQRVSTDAGLLTDVSDEHSENALPSMRRSLETGSNLKVERSLQFEKQHLQKTSTEDGMEID
jgi:hypothetical protein